MSEYQKNKKHVDGEETRRNVNIVKDCYYGGGDKDTVSALTQLFIVHCVVFRLAVMGNIEKGTVFNILWNTAQIDELCFYRLFCENLAQNKVQIVYCETIL